MRDLATFIRAHRARAGANRPPLYALQSDFARCGDELPPGHQAAVWPILREVAMQGSPGGELPEHMWMLICAVIRPVIRDCRGNQFSPLHGVALGTPLVLLVLNLAAVPMDRAVLAVDGIFYARYSDDFLLAHPDLDALRDADGVRVERGKHAQAPECQTLHRQTPGQRRPTTHAKRAALSG